MSFNASLRQDCQRQYRRHLTHPTPLRLKPPWVVFVRPNSLLLPTMSPTISRNPTEALQDGVSGAGTEERRDHRSKL